MGPINPNPGFLPPFAICVVERYTLYCICWYCDIPLLYIKFQLQVQNIFIQGNT